jgi:hypothetical protein
MDASPGPTCIAFDGDRRIGSGGLRRVARLARQALDRSDASILIFDLETSRPIDLDFRGTVDDVMARLPETAGAPTAATNAAPDAPRGPGRPKLGVVAREITLLPRHWDWLSQQSGGASVAIRKLVDDARRNNEARDRARIAQESAYRFMAVMAGNRPHYEDAIRALFAGDATRFEQSIGGWPADIRDHARHLAEAALVGEHVRDRAG